VQLLILDDWGLQLLDAAARHEILEERYGRRSTIVTSQIPVDKWLGREDSNLRMAA
jgi:DNA replication protein DnaC